ncbi:MAG: methyltransferase [Ignavibacteria bacterium]|nr:methyltransferase [Ignavibacteria bacterium]
MSEIHNKIELKQFRKQLRNSMTKAEVLLWINLKNGKLNEHKFRRQHSVGNYILDFYCPQINLALEIDGSQHYSDEGKEKDLERENFLKTLNIKVLRYSNFEVLSNIDGVIEDIRKNLPPPTTS